MKTSVGIKRIAKGRLVRGIAIVFLLYTAVDIACPQLCSEELVNLAAANQTLVSGASSPDPTSSAVLSVSVDNASHRNQPSKQESQDEDCFCCCAHVVAGMVFVPPRVLQQKSVVLIQAESSTPQNEFERPYHPPRFS